MAVLWVGAVVFLVLLFMFAVPTRGAGGGGQTRYLDRNMNYAQPQQQPPQQVYQQPYPQAQGRTGLQFVLALMFVAFVLFVGAVIFWSVSVQAGGF